MTQHYDATVFTYPVAQIAHAWREHAQRAGITDPETEILARQAVHGSPRAGYRPAWYVPSTGELVVIIAAEPHRTAAEARTWLRRMLEQLHNNGNITLYAETAPAQEATPCD
ncbi:MAG: hypothetical protein ACQEUG_15845 [Pseudomonadota bacterium]